MPPNVHQASQDTTALSHLLATDCRWGDFISMVVGFSAKSNLNSFCWWLCRNCFFTQRLTHRPVFITKAIALSDYEILHFDKTDLLRLTSSFSHIGSRFAFFCFMGVWIKKIPSTAFQKILCVDSSVRLCIKTYWGHRVQQENLQESLLLIN